MANNRDHHLGAMGPLTPSVNLDPNDPNVVQLSMMKAQLDGMKAQTEQARKATAQMPTPLQQARLEVARVVLPAKPDTTVARLEEIAAWVIDGTSNPNIVTTHEETPFEREVKASIAASIAEFNEDHPDHPIKETS